MMACVSLPAVGCSWITSVWPLMLSALVLGVTPGTFYAYRLLSNGDAQVKR